MISKDNVVFMGDYNDKAVNLTLLLLSRFHFKISPLQGSLQNQYVAVFSLDVDGLDEGIILPGQIPQDELPYWVNGPFIGIVGGFHNALRIKAVAEEIIRQM